MAITVIRNIALVNMAGNPMVIRVNSDNFLDENDEPRVFYSLFLSLYSEDPANVGATPFHVDSIQVDADGNGYFDISSVIKRRIRPTLPYPLNEAAQAVKDADARQEIWYTLAEGYGTPFVIQEVEITSTVRYAIPGGFSDEILIDIEAGESTQYAFLTFNKIFLTSQPEYKKVKNLMPETLRFFNPSETDVEAVLKVKQYSFAGEDPTTTEVWSGTLDALSLYTFNVTPGVAFTLNADTDTWEIWLENTTAQKVSEVIVHCLTDDLATDTNYVIFRNSLGGFDTLRTTGEINGNVESIAPVALTAIKTNFRNTLEPSQDRVMATEIYSGSIGYFSDIELKWLQEFFRSEKRHIIVNGKLQSLALRNGNQPSKAFTTPANIEFEAIVGVSDFFFCRLRSKYSVPKVVEILPPAINYTLIKNGYLYNPLAAVDPKGIANSDFAVPSESDFTTLIAHLGGSEVAGGKLKEISETYWNNPNEGASDEVGFKARGSGYRNSSFFDLKDSCLLGSSKFKLSFDYSTGFNNSIPAIAIDNNGKIYVGGSFTTYKGTTAIRIIRLNPDGSKDTDFDNSTGFNERIYSIAIDNNGKIYVGGSFTTYKGTAANRIIRLNPDGSKDTDFDNSIGFNSDVFTIAIDINGKIYVGGYFNTYKGAAANRIIRLNPDGSKDTDFDNSTGFNVYTSVIAITIDSIGKIYAVGSFTMYKGADANHIIRLNPDGSKDTDFDNSTGFNDIVLAIAIDSNGKIYAGGYFTEYKGAESNRIIKLNPDGSKDINFDNSTGFNEIVQAIEIESNGKIYIGGHFTDYKGTTANRIIKLNPDGSKDTDFDNSIGFNQSISVIKIDSNGNIYVGGAFTTYKGTAANRIIRLNPNGSKELITLVLKLSKSTPVAETIWIPVNFGLSYRLLRPATETDPVGDGSVCEPYIDVDLKIYRTVRIGDQVWLAGNLAATLYSDLTEIPLVTENGDWAALEEGGRCAFNNQNENV